MKEVKKEVKTEVIIQFDADDLVEVIKDAKEQWYSDEIFKNWDYTDKDNVQLRMMLWRPFTSEELRYIARYYGYDGWEHCGMYNKHNNAYQMTVCSIGDMMSC